MYLNFVEDSMLGRLILEVTKRSTKLKSLWYFLLYTSCVYILCSLLECFGSRSMALLLAQALSSGSCGVLNLHVDDKLIIEGSEIDFAKILLRNCRLQYLDWYFYLSESA